MNGEKVLKGSDEGLRLPTNEPMEIILFRENVGFLELSLCVSRAKSVTLTLTLANLQTMKSERTVASDAVSKSRANYSHILCISASCWQTAMTLTVKVCVLSVINAQK